MRPILQDLHDVGIRVSSPFDLKQRSEPYPEAIPILLGHLERGGYPSIVMTSIGSALTADEALDFWDQIKTVYLTTADSDQENAAATALGGLAKKEHLEEIIGFLTTEDRGESRLHFFAPIKRMAKANGRARAIMESLIEHPVLGREARVSVGLGDDRNPRSKAAKIVAALEEGNRKP